MVLLSLHFISVSIFYSHLLFHAPLFFLLGLLFALTFFFCSASSFSPVMLFSSSCIFADVFLLRVLSLIAFFLLFFSATCLKLLRHGPLLPPVVEQGYCQCRAVKRSRGRKWVVIKIISLPLWGFWGIYQQIFSWINKCCRKTNMLNNFHAIKRGNKSMNSSIAVTFAAPIPFRLKLGSFSCCLATIKNSH